MIKRFLSIAAIAAVCGVSLLAAPAQAATKSYSYVKGINCGTVSPVRDATLTAGGTFTSKLSLSGYSFSWDNHKSVLGYHACGSAAPYGSYWVNAKGAKLTTKFIVVKASLKKCTASGEAGASYDKAKTKASVGVKTSCALRARDQDPDDDRRHVRQGQEGRPPRAGASIDMTGGYCNSASLKVVGAINDPKYDFGGGSGQLEIQKKVVAC